MKGLLRHKNRYKELLHLCFPEFELCFKDGKIYDLTALNLIKEFPHAYIIKNNVRIMLINNGRGQEFCNFDNAILSHDMHIVKKK